MSEHKKPAPGSGYDRLPQQAHRLLEYHGGGKLVHHISITKSLLGERMKAGNFPADVQHALEAFGMQGAEEDNSDSAGYAHHFWLPANPQRVN